MVVTRYPSLIEDEPELYMLWEEWTADWVESRSEPKNPPAAFTSWLKDRAEEMGG